MVSSVGHLCFKQFAQLKCLIMIIFSIATSLGIRISPTDFLLVIRAMM